MKEIFQTARLLVREFVPRDWEDLYEMNTSRDVMRMIASGNRKTREEEKDGFERIRENYKAETGMGVWAVATLSENIFLGAASLSALKGTGEIQIGYRFKKIYWGKGYATEVAIGLIQYGFAELHLHKIAATTNPENNASRRVLEKAGFVFQRKDIFYDWEMNYFEIKRPAF